MRATRTTIIGLLLIAVVLISPAWAGSATVLLQEGLYAEEIEGDIDGAIKIYEKVVADAAELEQAAAQAIYRIGICYVKKGDKAKAAEYFGKVVSEHARQKALATKAQEQLTKLGVGQPESTEPKANLYEQLDYEVIRAIAGKYGSISAKSLGP